MTQPLLSIIVLNYNGARHNSRCLRSLLEQDLAGCEIVFADNGSSDGSFEEARSEFPSQGIHWIQNGANLGYAGGNNAAARNASGRYLLFLNNDTEMAPDMVRNLKASLERYPEAAGGQCALVRDAERTRLEAAGVDVDVFGFCYSRKSGERPDESAAVEPIFSGIGAALVVSADVFRGVGGFDESYFLLYEETDLCWRLAVCGYSMLYFPSAQVYHVGSGTRVPGPSQVEWFIRNRVRTIRKNAGAFLLPLSLLGNVAGMAALACAYSVTRRPEMAAATLRGLREGLMDSAVAANRRTVQQMRKVSDAELVRRGMLRLPNFRLLLRNVRAYV